MSATPRHESSPTKCCWAPGAHWSLVPCLCGCHYGEAECDQQSQQTSMRLNAPRRHPSKLPVRMTRTPHRQSAMQLTF